MQNMLQISCCMICAANRSNGSQSDPWGQQTEEQETELCDTCSEAKQEGLIPVTIQGFVTFMRWIQSGFWLKLCVRILQVIMPVLVSKTPLPWSLTFLIFVLKISLLFTILHLHYMCISAIFSILLLSCKYFNARIQFNLIFYIELR